MEIVCGKRVPSRNWEKPRCLSRFDSWPARLISDIPHCSLTHRQYLSPGTTLHTWGQEAHIVISISIRLERETIIPHLFHSSFQFSTHNSIEIPNIKIKQSRISSRISQSRPISSWRKLTTSDNTLKRRVAIKQRTTHSAPVDELHEDHAMASYLGKRRERISSTSYYESRMEQHVMQRHFS